MLIVAGHFDVDPADRDAFLRSRQDAMRRSRAEAGCVAYVFSADPIEAGRVWLFERWESKEALAAHLAAMRSAPRPAADPSAPRVSVLSSEVLQYEISNTGPVGS